MTLISCLVRGVTGSRTKSVGVCGRASVRTSRTCESSAVPFRASHRAAQLAEEVVGAPIRIRMTKSRHPQSLRTSNQPSWFER